MSQTNVYFNHDGGVDDLVSLFMLLQMEQVHLTGVSVVPARRLLGACNGRQP
jgi:purine nucleosidase